MDSIIGRFSKTFVGLLLVCSLIFNTIGSAVVLAVDEPASSDTASQIDTTNLTVTNSESTPDATVEPTPTPTPTNDGVTEDTTIIGPASPTGNASRTYIYNKATGMWENDYYIWDPATNQTSPKNPPNYSYNPLTGMWDTTEWLYNPVTGIYEANIVSVAVNPSLQGGAVVDEGNTKGPIDTVAASGIFNLFFNAVISNHITSSAQSGDALVSGNTLAGNASSGDASALLSIFNLINSAWSYLTGHPILFTANINGDLVGDMYIDPGNLAVTQTEPVIANLQVNTASNDQIDNNIKLDVVSGDAVVQLNTSAGDATTGKATAMVNIINLLNSSIGAGQSFLGMLNINGNLNGDILLPESVLQLLSDNSTASSVSRNISANVTDNQAINNQITTNAQTGLATLSNNTMAGNAVSGQAVNNITLLNLTGKQVMGQDALLVFVNVLGNWTGLIMNAPIGSTAGLIGNTVNENGLQPLSGEVAINATSSNQINNRLVIDAISGDATVSDNSKAGNASSGDASASANVLNMINSSFALSGWFGILFINVLGNWYGSFGVNTAAGNPVMTPPATLENIVNRPTFGFAPTNQAYDSYGNNAAAIDVDSAPTTTATSQLFTGTLGEQNNPTQPVTIDDTPLPIYLWVALAGLLTLGLMALAGQMRHRTAATA